MQAGGSSRCLLQKQAGQLRKSSASTHHCMSVHLRQQFELRRQATSSRCRQQARQALAAGAGFSASFCLTEMPGRCLQQQQAGGCASRLLLPALICRCT